VKSLAARAELLLATLALGGIMLLPLAEIFSRKFLGQGIPGAGPYAQHSTMWVGLLGAAIAAREGKLLSLATGEFLPKGPIGSVAHIIAGAIGSMVATLFAFGMRPRRVLALGTVEGLLIGLIGAAIGVAGGLLLNRWIITSTLATTMPDMAMDVVGSTGNGLTAGAPSVIAVGVAPVFYTQAPWPIAVALENNGFGRVGVVWPRG